MKKTITINLAGIVFHIEEDAYDVLQQYLGSVKNYFLKVEGGADILGDIESRIAELFTGFLSEFKQAISIDDVQSVIQQMGTVEDMVGEDAAFSSPTSDGADSGNYQEAGSGNGSKRLVRDSTNGLIGGVCAGLAAYFEVNPLWVRLATLALFFGFAFFPALSGTVFISYIVLWIAMPAQANLENHGNFRKFFRSRKDKILGGVAGGVGTYFGVDPVVVRVLFVLFIVAGGSGILLYILLWAITPEAKSVTDDLQMKGDPVTLNNIEEQIKKNVHLSDKATESTVIKILVFPFKLAALVFTALSPFLRFLVDAVRVFTAIILFIIGASFLCGLVILVLASLGLMDNYQANIRLGDFPVAKLTEEITPWMIGFGSLAAIVPVIIILLISMSLMFRKTFINPVVGVVMVFLFFVGLIGFGVSVLPVVQQFSNEGSVVINKDLKSGYNKMAFTINQNDGNNSELYPVQLRIRGWENNTMQLHERFMAQGSSWKDASNNARLAAYQVAQQDSSVIFDSNLSLDPNLPYRAQRLNMTLYVPYGQIFTMDPAMESILHNTLYKYGYSTDQLEGNSWMFTQSGLKCLTCKETGEDDAAEEPASPELNENQDDDWE